MLTADLKEAPDEEVTVEITFECGVPVAINGKENKQHRAD